MSKRENFKFYSYFNLLAIFISSFILFAPMMIYLKEYKSSGNMLISEGYNNTINLAITISLVILSTIFSFWVFWKWSNDVKLKLANILKEKEYKWVLITSGISFLSIIFFMVAFFVIWMFPLYGLSTSDNLTTNKIRMNIYIITYCVLITIMLLASLFSLSWFNLKIDYLLNKTKHEKK